MQRQAIITLALLFTACDGDDIEFRDAEPCQTEFEIREPVPGGSWAPVDSWRGCSCLAANGANFMVFCGDGSSCAICCGKADGTVPGGQSTCPDPPD